MPSAENNYIYYITLHCQPRLPPQQAKEEEKKKEVIKPVVEHKEEKHEEPKVVEKKEEKKDEDDFDLFDDKEDPELEAINEARRQKALEDSNAKKANKGVIAKSSLILDVAPWDDETPMDKLEAAVRSIQMDGLIWGASKLVDVVKGIKKLSIAAVVEDDKCSVDELEERITAFEDYVQSMDIAAFNKI